MRPFTARFKKQLIPDPSVVACQGQEMRVNRGESYAADEWVF
jgi:hypothetical protein